MNIFADIRTLVVETLDAMVAEGGCRTACPGALSRWSRRAMRATATWRRTRRWCWRSPRECSRARSRRPRRAASPTPASKAAEVAGPGFLNLRLAPQVWHDVVTEAIDAGRAFGHSGMGAGVKVNVEFVSANPTGPLHVGHTRGAVFGDALASFSNSRATT
jgi:arginyl-tRNA synthetase